MLVELDECKAIDERAVAVESDLECLTVCGDGGEIKDGVVDLLLLGGDGCGVGIGRGGGIADVDDQIIVIAVECVVVEVQLVGAIALLGDGVLRRAVDGLFIAGFLDCWKEMIEPSGMKMA